MMTALVTIERGGPDATVEIRVATQVEPNLAGFMAGQAVTRRVLLWATLLESANDAAVALAYDGGNGSLALLPEDERAGPAARDERHSLPERLRARG